MVKAKVFVYNKRFDGLPKEGDLIIKEEELPPLKNGEFLAEAVYVSVDTYNTSFASTLPLGSVVLGCQVAKIVESKHSNYPVGRHVEAFFGWRTHTISDGKANETLPAPFLVPDLADVPVSYSIGVLGVTGNTAYFGFLEICQPKKGETVVVSGAGGAVGSIVGQIAKIKGCTVIGIAGSDEKGKWLKDELGFDHFINYKTDDIDKVLSQIAPQGVDCYFDNVGGRIAATVIKHINMSGKISMCGLISHQHNEYDEYVPLPYSSAIGKQVKLEGFLVFRWLDRYEEGIRQNLKWIREGKLKPKETVTVGFENMVEAFVDMMTGKNFGKAIVKV